MLTVNDVSFKCIGRNTFARGQLIYNVKNVKKFKIKNTKKENHILIKARVKGNNIDDFDTEAVVNEAAADIEKAKCGCAENCSAANLCKHCVAMLLEYIDRRDGVEEDAQTAAAGRCTDESFGLIMEKFSMSKRVDYLQPEITGKVQIIPELILRYNVFEVIFKIGINNFYLVKNLKNFVREVKNIEKAKYGPSLEFYNTIGAYEPKSKELVRFIISYYENDIAGIPVSGDSYKMCMAVMLKNNILDEFMELIKDETVSLDEDGYYKRKVTIKNGILKENLRIEGREDGILLHIGQIKMLYGRRYAYMLSKEAVYRIEREICENLEACIRYGSEYKYRGIFISQRDLPLFVRDMLPDLKKLYTIEEDDFDEKEYESTRAELKIYLDAPEKNTIICKALAFYDDNTDGVNIFEQGLPESGRDMTGEIMAAARIYGMFNSFDFEKKCPVLNDNDEKLFFLLTEGIDILRTLGEVYISDNIKKIHIRPQPKIQIGISLAGDCLEMDFDGGEMSGEQLAEILSRYDRKQKYYRLKNGDFIHINNKEFSILSEMNETLSIRKKELAKGKIKIEKYRSFYIDASLREFTSIQYNYDTGFRRLVENIKSSSDSHIEAPKEMENILREYQKQGFVWLRALKDNGFGAVLADEMGLGKTLQVIALLLSCKEEKGPSIIICPASLIYNWKSEIERFAPSLKTILVAGSVETRQEILKNTGETDILITSYDLLKRDAEMYEDIYFNCQIVDEAQYIKNYNTQATKAVKTINAGFKAALTGTPVENRLSELWSIFDYIMPGFLYRYSVFREKIEAPVVMKQDKAALKFLQKMIGPFVLRRLKKDVLKFLPDKIEKNMYAKLEGEQWEIYQAHVQRIRLMLNSQSDTEFSKSKIQILAELTKLRQICCNPALLYESYAAQSAKTVMCVELVKNAIEGGHKILVFSQFTSMLEILEEELKREKIGYLALTGETPKEKRAALVKDFNEGAAQVFCISLKAGGTGLNLTAADIVIHYDPWWNVAVQNQATDRAHRIGQERVVTVYKLIAKDSIEEGIVELQDKKRELAEEILGNESISSADFTKEMLLELLK